ncbi:MAG: tail fiber protein, partial [Bacteroidia bacterium]|nr:tail fiber protein [Bacteroidia bacterium]
MKKKLLIILLLYSLNSTAQNVGIGNSNPLNKLEITSASPNTSGLRFTNLTAVSPPSLGNGLGLSVDANGDVLLVPSSANAWLLTGNSNATAVSFLGTTNAFDLVFKTANIEIIRILNTNGFVGIGTAAPTAPLQLGNGLYFGEGGLGGVSATGADIRFSTNGLIVADRILHINIDGNNATTNSYFAINKDAQTDVATELMRVQENGNVGIGTTNPQRTLHLHSAANNFHAIELTAENQTDWWDIVRRGQTYATPNCFVISHNGQTDFNISPTGNVGIAQVANPSAMLDIISTTSGFAMPRMTTAQRIAIVAPIDGLQVYDINLKDYYYADGGVWDCVSTRAGTVGYFANATAPRGYVVCDGTGYSTTQYPELFTAVGYVYGGAGVTFNVPDLRGEFVRGID